MPCFAAAPQKVWYKVCHAPYKVWYILTELLILHQKSPDASFCSLPEHMNSHTLEGMQLVVANHASVAGKRV